MIAFVINRGRLWPSALVAPAEVPGAGAAPSAGSGRPSDAVSESGPRPTRAPQRGADSSARPCLAPWAGRAQGTAPLAGRLVPFPLRSAAGERTSPRSGSVGVNVTPASSMRERRSGSEGGRADLASWTAVTPPASAVAEPDRDLTTATRAYSEDRGRAIAFALAWVLLLTAVALALWAPRPVDPVTGAPGLTAVHLVLVPALVLAAAWITDRLRRFTR